METQPSLMQKYPFWSLRVKALTFPSVSPSFVALQPLLTFHIVFLFISFSRLFGLVLPLPRCAAHELHHLPFRHHLFPTWLCLSFPLSASATSPNPCATPCFSSLDTIPSPAAIQHCPAPVPVGSNEEEPKLPNAQTTAKLLHKISLHYRAHLPMNKQQQESLFLLTKTE